MPLSGALQPTKLNEIILNGYIAHVTKRQSGKKGFYYQIRYRRNGYNVEASSVNLQEAKRKFLEKTKPENIGKYLVKKMKSGFNLLEEIFEEWHAYKKGTVYICFTSLDFAPVKLIMTRTKKETSLLLVTANARTGKSSTRKSPYLRRHRD